MNESHEAHLLAGVGMIRGVYEQIRPDTAEKAWVGILGAVALYEAYCKPNELLSCGADRMIERHPIATRLAIGITAMHLANGFESLGLEKLDPLHQISEFIKRKVD